jgi:hypothetical protein
VAIYSSSSSYVAAYRLIPFLCLKIFSDQFISSILTSREGGVRGSGQGREGKEGFVAVGIVS